MEDVVKVEAATNEGGQSAASPGSSSADPSNSNDACSASDAPGAVPTDAETKDAPGPFSSSSPAPPSPEGDPGFQEFRRRVRAEHRARYPELEPVDLER